MFKQLEWFLDTPLLKKGLRDSRSNSREPFHLTWIWIFLGDFVAAAVHHQVETFLESFHWKSRSEGMKDSTTQQGERVSSFIVTDGMSHKCARGYSVVAKRSAKDPNRLICHLEDFGRIKGRLRLILPAVGRTTLGEWAAAKFPGVQTILFD